MEYIVDEYFKWLCNYIKNGKYRNRNKLLAKLHDVDYMYHVDFDRNRAKDGINMRRYFSEETGYDDILYWNRKCSVLEMIVGLAVQMQNMTEDTSSIYNADRWFWDMLENLELAYMTNNKFSNNVCENILEIFLDRKYNPNGYKYNLFIIDGIKDDLTKVETWYQMCWYIEDIYN